MKRAVLVPLGSLFTCSELRDGLDYWLPAIGCAGERGYVWVQYSFLTLIGTRLCGSGVLRAYRFLNEILDW